MRVILAVGLVIALSGCASPPAIPDDAVHDSLVALPGLELSAWVEHRNGFTYLHAVAENSGRATYETKEDCGYLWQSELRFNGTLVAYAAPEERVCDWVWDFMRPGDWRQFLHSWDGRTWANGTAADAQAGDYVWTIRFLLRDGSDHETQTPMAGRFLDATVTFTR